MDADFIIRTFVLSTSKTASLPSSGSGSGSSILPAIFTLTSVILGVLQGHFANQSTANAKWASLPHIPLATRTIPGPPSPTFTNSNHSPYIWTSLIVIFIGILVGAAATGYQRTKTGMTFTPSKTPSSNGNGGGRGGPPRRNPSAPPPPPPPPRRNQPNRRRGGRNPGDDPNPQGNETSIKDKGKDKNMDKRPRHGSNPGGNPDDPNGGSKTQQLPNRPPRHRPEDGPGPGIFLWIGLFIWYFYRPQLRTAKAWLDAVVEQELRRLNDGFGRFAAIVEHELHRVNVGRSFDGTSEILRRGSNVGGFRPMHPMEDLEEFRFRTRTLPGLLSSPSPVVRRVVVRPRQALPAAQVPDSLIVFNSLIPNSLKVALGGLILSLVARHRHRKYVQSSPTEPAPVSIPYSKLCREVPVDLYELALNTRLPADEESDFPVQDLLALALAIQLPPDRQEDFPVHDLFAVAPVPLSPDQEQDFSPVPLPPVEEAIDDSFVFVRELESDISPRGSLAVAPTTPLPRHYRDHVLEEVFEYLPRGSHIYERGWLSRVRDLLELADANLFDEDFLALAAPLPPDKESDSDGKDEGLLVYDEDWLSRIHDLLKLADPNLLDEDFMALATSLPLDNESDWEGHADSDLLDEDFLALETPLPSDKESDWEDEIDSDMRDEHFLALETTLTLEKESNGEETDRLTAQERGGDLIERWKQALPEPPRIAHGKTAGASFARYKHGEPLDNIMEEEEGVEE